MARNQPQFNLLTGEPEPALARTAREPLRETFRASQIPVRLGWTSVTYFGTEAD